MKQKAGSLKKLTRLTNPWQIWLKWDWKRPKLVKSEMIKGR
jgi:hypothetical protein